jgi:hypothetical protein
MFFLNYMLTYSLTDEEYECHPSLVLEALRENQHYVELKKGVFYLFGVVLSNQMINQYGITVEIQRMSHSCGVARALQCDKTL